MSATSHPLSSPCARHSHRTDGPARAPRQRQTRHATQPLREGFTTGTAATAAACAAFALLLGHKAMPYCLVPLPPQPVMPALVNEEDTTKPQNATRLNVPIAESRLVAPGVAEARVIKDAGDDPDVTHGASIIARLELMPNAVYPPFLPDALPPASGHPLLVELRSGEGVGHVTLPGLPVPVGEPAINPAPRRQIACALNAMAAESHFTGRLRLTLSIPGGEALAQRTLNPRLGIVGGLSILGTHGTVRPYSHDAWAASIAEALSVAKATGHDEVMLATGRRSEKLLQGLYPHLAAPAFVQVADFAAFSLQEAARLAFQRITWGCFFGKLVKLAQGLPCTHAHEAPLNLAQLALWCHEAGMTNTAPIATCTTAGQALEYILLSPAAPAVLQALTLRARCAAERFLTNPPPLPTKQGRPSALSAPLAPPVLRLHLFHINGQELARA